MDSANSKTERRRQALGANDLDRLPHVTFTLRAASRPIRAISARGMRREERNVYAQTD